MSTTYYDRLLYVRETTVTSDAANNRTYVRYECWITGNGSYGTDTATGNTHFDGDSVYFSVGTPHASYYITLRDEYRWLYHNAYGDRNVATGASMRLSALEVNYSTNFSVDLPNLASIPNVVTWGSGYLTPTSCVTYGNLISYNNNPVWDAGIAFSRVTSAPLVSGTHISVTSAIGLYQANLTGLDPGYTYYFRAYATNNIGTAYGATITFVTPGHATMTGATGSINDTATTAQIWLNNPASATVDGYIELPNKPAGALAPISDITSSPATFTLNSTFWSAVYTAMTSVKSTVLRYVIHDALGGTNNYSYLDYTVTIIDANPTFTNFTYLDTNAFTVAITENDQYIIQGYSTLGAVISSANKAVAIKGATMDKYTFNVAGGTVEQAYSTSTINKDIGVLSVNSNQTLSVTAIDSRTNSTPVTKTVNVLPYAAPVIVASGLRDNNFEDATTLSVSGTFSRLTVISTDKNTVASDKVKYRYKQDGGAFGSWVTMTRTVGTGTFATTSEYLTLANSSTFDFEISVTDSLATTVSTLTVGRGVPLLMVSNNLKAIGINKMPDGANPGLYLTPTDNFWLQMYAVGDIFMTTTSANPSARFGGTWVAWGAGRVPVGMGSNGVTNYTTVETIGGVDGVTLATTQIPSHNHLLDMVANSGAGALGNGYGTSVGNPRYAIPSVDHPASGEFTGWGIQNAGGGQSHENRMPFITCYMWKRTA